MRKVLILFLVAAASPAMAQPGEKTYAAFPTGQGDPDQLTCRPPQQLQDSRLMGPEVCKRNYEWARYRRDRMDVAPDGIHDIPLRPSQSCQPTQLGGNSTATAGNVGIACN
jgi:hypothetical protein